MSTDSLLSKTYNGCLISQLLYLSLHIKRERKVSGQIKALHTLVNLFGNSKMLMNAAIMPRPWLELHFNEHGHIKSAKVFAFVLDESHVGRLSHEERTFHMYYQFG